MAYATDHITAALKAAREKKAISQRELSAKAGVPQAQISRLESGAVDIRLSSLVALARALDLEVELVPRKAVSAVETIVRATTSAERPMRISYNTEQVSKLVRALQNLDTVRVPPTVLERTLSHARMLERFQPTAQQLAMIESFTKELKRSKALDIDPGLFAQYAKAIEHIRNQVVHAPPPALPPKPAYALDEEEDDA